MASRMSRRLEGKAVLLHFWSITCSLCHDVAQTVNAWRDRYESGGIVFISVHQPRLEQELDVQTVRDDAVTEMGLTQPCAIDNEHTIVDRFENQFVPAYYLFDRAHRLRHFQAGDKGYDRIETAIQRVVTEEAQAVLP